MIQFCQLCKQEIIIAGLFSKANPNKPVRFEDGIYCFECAQIKVKKVRETNYE